MVATGYSLARIALLGIWIGALLVFAAVVIPAAFEHLPTQLAAAVLGDGFAALDRAGAVLGALCIALGFAAAARDNAARWRALLPGLGVAAHVANVSAITPRLHALRVAAGGTIGELAAGDPKLAEFAQLHLASRALFFAAVASAAAACVWDVAALRKRPAEGRKERDF